MTHFNTVELYETRAEIKANAVISSMQYETLESLQASWKLNKTVASSTRGSLDNDIIQHRRLENISWRLMAKRSQCALTTSPTQKQEEIVPTCALEDLTKVGWPDSDEFCLLTPSSTATRLEKLGDASAAIGTIGGLGPEMEEEGEKVSMRKSKSLQVFTSPPSNSNFRMSAVSPMASPQSLRLRLEASQMATPVNAKYGRSNTNRAFERQLGQIGKGTMNVEYSDLGTGDFRQPSFMIVNSFDGSTISPLRYCSHKIIPGKLKMQDDMPGVRCSSPDEATTLVVTMIDAGSFLEVDLIYVAMHEYDVITRRVVFRNVDTRSKGGTFPDITKILQKASSLTIDFESASVPFYLLKLSGSWGRERQIAETKLTQGTETYGSVRGVSGHQHSPFAAITIGPPNELTGETKGFSLVYSGNFLIEADLSDTGRLRFNMGIHPTGMQWHIKSGQEFHTPEAIMVRSSEGLGGMSRVLHRILLDKLIAPLPDWARATPPVLLNSWEAKYFNVSHAGVVEMAKHASRIGIDMIVLDDGWFGKRNDDTTSLGDWYPNPEKFPLGLGQLAKEVNAQGCRFGLWFEPEMVSEHSDLNNMHSDWYLRAPGRPRQIGRNQMVLDLSRSDVREYLFQAISKVLKSANIDYIKWDMNRPLTEVYSQRTIEEHFTVNDSWQSETSHRYVLGVYELQSRIIKAFPNVLLENCASGGGRFDLGMLYFSPQIWCSDNTDAIMRMKIQFGTSIAYPARCVGSHVSFVPNHITGNTTRARTRGFVAMCGTFGYELDISSVSPQDRLVFQEQIELFRLISPTIHTGDLYRLWDPFKINLAAWMFVSRDKCEAVVFAFSVNSDHWSNLVPRLTLQGLLPDAEYEVSEPMPNNISQNTGNLQIIESEVPTYQLGYNTVTLTGEILMSAGLPIKFFTLDDAVLFTLSSINVARTRTAYDF